MKRALSLLLVSGLVLIGCSGSKTRLKTGKTMGGEVVEAEGMAPYKADDLTGTKAAALAAAQKAAVELVVGVYVTAKTRVEKAVAIEQNILTRTSGYVKKYDILKEWREGDWYKIRIRALVATDKIHEDLDSLGALKRPDVAYPRVALAIQEFVGEKPNKDASATRAVTQVLLSKGYKVVDLPASIRNEEDPIEAAQKMNRKTADLLLAGLARAQSLEYGKKEFGGMHSYRAGINFRVIEAETGEVMATVSQTASGIEATAELAAQKAFQQAAELMNSDLASLPNQLAQKAHLDLNIVGLKSFEALSKLQKSLATEPGVKDLYLRSYNQEDGVASIDLLVDRLSAQELAERAVRIGGADWSILQVGGRSVQLTATQAGR